MAKISEKGTQTAVKHAVEASGDLVRPAGKQLPLPAMVEEDAAVEKPDDGERRGPGRPAGSPNRATAELRRWLLSQYTSPLQAMAEIASRPTAQFIRDLQAIAKEVGMPTVGKGQSVLDVFKLQMSLAAELAPYVHQKQPQALQVEGKGGLVELHMHLGGLSESVRQAGVAVDDDAIIDLEPISGQLAENSENSHENPDELDNGELDNDENSAENSE